MNRAITVGLAGAAALALREALLRRSELDLGGKVALVSGGSRGLGFLIARELLHAGARVSICARDAAELERARELLAPDGVVHVSVCDVGHADEVRAWVASAREALGPIDILVNNAGVISLAPLRHATVADFAQAMDTMFWGTLYPTLEVLPEMRERRAGRVVNVTSLGGRFFPPHTAPYGAAKAAATALSEALRPELAHDGILVTTVLPGFMRTGSDVQVQLKGEWREDFLAWAIGANLPGLSYDAERAAARIVRALRRGEPELIIGLAANVAVRLHGIAPGLVTRAFEAAVPLLPGSTDGDPTVRRGKDLQREPHPAILDRLRGWNRDAARRFNQEPAEERIGSDPI